MSSPRHPILADTSALIALGMSSCWETAKRTLKLTTTNVCQTELKRHARENRAYAPEDSREYRLHHGSTRSLTAFEEPECSFSVVTVVPAPSGEDVGEESPSQELQQYPDSYSHVVLNDVTYRDRLRTMRDRGEYEFRVVPPTFLLYVLHDNGRISKPEFCRACEEMMRGEGWTNAGAVHEMWRSIPVDCRQYVDDSLLPD